MRTKLFFLTTILAISLTAAAGGDRIGNGGKGIVCGKSSHKDIRLLDFYESNLALRKDLNGLSREDVLAKIFANLQRVAPVLAKQYSKRATEIMTEIEFKSGAVLKDTEDSMQLALPQDSSCHLEQIVIRRTEVDALTKPFLFSEDLWKEMKPVQQAGLLLHEIVYEHFWKLGEKTSVKARKITGYLASEKSVQDSPDEFWRMIQSLRLPIYR